MAGEGGPPTRGRSDSNGQQRGDSWPGGPLSLSTASSGAQIMASSSGSDRLDAAAEVPSPPLALISSRVKSASALESCANFETETVRYAYETTSPSRLLRAVGEKLRGRKALSVALVVHGSPGCFKLCSQKTVTCTCLREDEELRKFFETLVSSYLHSHSQYARIDILNCPVAQNQEGEQLISDMENLLGVPVFSYSDIQGAQISEAGSTETGRYSRIGTLYFDNEKLKDWSATAHQTMALFERIRTVGKGAYGAAVLYRKKDDGSHVILKEINLMDLTKTERYSAMNEAQILSRLDHPNIISYYDNFEEDGVLMIEMEYADGGTLAQFLQKQMSLNKTLSERDVVTMFSQMVDALKYLHDHNILHRDLKTANVFLTKEGIVKLGDFGISKILSATSPEANTVLGTPYYISPEICEGKHYDAKSDIWALGCILYEMVCLQKTFEGTNLPVLVHKIVEVSFAPVKGDYSDNLKQLITEMLRKNPEDRPSAKEIFTTSLPLLASQFASNEYEEEEEEKDEMAKTHTKSLLYYLDGVSLLLHHIPATFQTRLDHIAVGYGHALALGDEGLVFSWGVGSRGQLGHGDREMRRNPVIIESVKGKRIGRVECGGEYSVLVADNGILMTCGRGDRGIQGHHDNQDCLKPKLVEDLITHDVVQVGCGESHIAVVTSENRVLVWGAGKHGQLGTGDEEDRNHPVEVMVYSPGSKMAEVICNVKCGLDGTMMLTDTGRLFACGSNQDNKLGLNRRETFIMQMRKILNKDRQLQVSSMSVPTPLKELGKHRVVDMSLGPTHSTVLAELGRVFTFGRNSEGQLCSGNTLPQNIPVPVRHHHTTPTMVTSSELCSIVTTADNSFLIWGSRPVIKSPLIEILEQSFTTTKTPLSPSHRSTSGDITETVFIDNPHSSPGTPNIKRGPSISDPPLPKISDPSPPVEGSVDNREKSSNEVITKGSPTRTTSRDSVSSVPPRMIGNSSRNPSFDFSDVPHSLVSCSECEQYRGTLSEVLMELLDSSLSAVRGGGGGGVGKTQSLKRESTSGTQIVSSQGRRVTSSSSIYTISSGREGSIIMQPTSMDLVGRSGILNLLSVEGITEAKLEGLSCYGGNVLVLIHAQVVMGTRGEGERKKGAGKSSGELPTFKIGRRITQRAQLRRVSPFQPPPSLHSTLPPPLHPPISLPRPPNVNHAESTADDSMVETWIREVYEEAKRESEGENTPLESQKQTGTSKPPETIVKNTSTKPEAWKTSSRIRSASPTLFESGAGRVKPEIKVTSGVKPYNQEPINIKETPPQTASKNISSTPEKKERENGEDSSAPAAHRQPQRQLTPHKLIQPAASTSHIAGGERKNPLNVKRVSSSGDLARGARHGPRASTAAPGRGAGGPGVHKNQNSGVPGSRRLSDNAGGRGRGREVGVGEGGKPKEQRLSIATSDKIRLPSARGEKGLPTLPPEVSGGSTSGVNRQSTTGSDKPSSLSLSSGSPKTKPSAKHRSLVESSPYAEPVPRIVRPGSKPVAKSRSPSNLKNISISERNLHRKAQSKEEVEEEEKEKAGPVVGRQLKESQEREQEMKAHVQKLESQLERQQSQIESNENAMRELNQRLLEIQQERASTAQGRQRRRRSAQIFGSPQVSPTSSTATDESSDREKRGKSRFCSVM